MSGHTQQVIRHLPEENKLNKTRNLVRPTYSVRTTLSYNEIFYSRNVHYRFPDNNFKSSRKNAAMNGLNFSLEQSWYTK